MYLQASLIILLVSIQIIASSPNPSSENWNNEHTYHRQRRSVNSETKAILAQAKSVTKPKGSKNDTIHVLNQFHNPYYYFVWNTDYEKIVKQARKFDTHPEIVNEVNELVPQPFGNIGKAFVTDKNKRWKYQMLIVIDGAFCNYNFNILPCVTDNLEWLKLFSIL